MGEQSSIRWDQLYAIHVVTGALQVVQNFGNDVLIILKDSEKVKFLYFLMAVQNLVQWNHTAAESTLCWHNL